MQERKEKNIIYIAGQLRINKSSLLPTPIQQNLVVAVKKNDLYIIIGFLSNDIRDENYKECNCDNMPSYLLVNNP